MQVVEWHAGCEVMRFPLQWGKSVKVENGKLNVLKNIAGLKFNIVYKQVYAPIVNVKSAIGVISKSKPSCWTGSD